MTSFNRYLEGKEMLQSLVTNKRTLLFETEIDSRLVCQLCGNLMKEPIQTIRGMMSCKSCYISHIPKDISMLQEITCPLDGEVYLPKEQKVFYRSDKYIAREISKIRVKCEFEKCEWVGCLDDINNHEASDCDYAYSQCDECYQEVLRKDMKNHQANCGANANSESVQFSQELANSYVDSEVLKSKTLTDSSPEQLDDLLDKVQKLSSENKKLKAENEKIFKTVDKANKQCDEQKKEVEVLKSEVQRMKEFIKRKNDQIRDLTTGLNNVLRAQERMYSSDFFESKIDKLNKVQMPNDSDLSRVTSELGKLHTYDAKMQKLENSQAVLSANLADAELKVQLLEHQSNNGHQIWRIDNFAYRIDQALKGNVIALHSAPCFTHGINGYKFCVRVYPNGDGIGRNSHLSIYFVLMKNNYDHLLTWPFYRKISFKVLNIKDPSKTKKETFITDKMSSSFRKPEKDMNIAAGCPKFISKESLLNDGFLVDDSIYVETIVQEVP